MPLTPTVIWLVIGAVLCLTELFLPTAFIACVMGISALLVAAVSQLMPLGMQVMLWMGLSLALTLASRRFIPQPRTAAKLDATEAETLTAIPPGKTGRVLYEGNSWAAQCEDERLAIAPNQKVYVVSRRGTMLIVLPESLVRP